MDIGYPEPECSRRVGYLTFPDSDPARSRRRVDSLFLKEAIEWAFDSAQVPLCRMNWGESRWHLRRPQSGPSTPIRERFWGWQSGIEMAK
jgi:hypothetical protein